MLQTVWSLIFLTLLYNLLHLFAKCAVNISRMRLLTPVFPFIVFNRLQIYLKHIGYPHCHAAITVKSICYRSECQHTDRGMPVGDQWIGRYVEGSDDGMTWGRRTFHNTFGVAQPNTHTSVSENIFDAATSRKRGMWAGCHLPLSLSDKM